MTEILIAIALFGGMLLSLELSYSLGRRAKERTGDDKSQLGTIQGAVLGLLGLLLGFSFAAAASRFTARQDLIVSEANAIGTAWLRAGLLAAPQQGELRGLLKDYTSSRVDWYNSRNPDEFQAARTRSEALHGRMWEVAERGVIAAPQVTIAVLPPINEVIDLHSTRLAAAYRHLPLLLIGLLIGCALVAVGTVGYGCGLSGRRNRVFTTALGLLIAAVLWIVIDLDHPRRGLIRSGQQPMLELQRSLASEAPKPLPAETAPPR